MTAARQNFSSYQKLTTPNHLIVRTENKSDTVLKIKPKSKTKTIPKEKNKHSDVNEFYSLSESSDAIEDRLDRPKLGGPLTSDVVPNSL